MEQTLVCKLYNYFWKVPNGSHFERALNDCNVNDLNVIIENICLPIFWIFLRRLLLLSWNLHLQISLLLPHVEISKCPIPWDSLCFMLLNLLWYKMIWSIPPGTNKHLDMLSSRSCFICSVCACIINVNVVLQFYWLKTTVQTLELLIFLKLFSQLFKVTPIVFIFTV